MSSRQTVPLKFAAGVVMLTGSVRSRYVVIRRDSQASLTVQDSDRLDVSSCRATKTGREPVQSLGAILRETIAECLASSSQGHLS